MTRTPSRLVILQQRCALQRSLLTADVAHLAQRLQRIDHALAPIQTFATHPAMFASVLTLLFSARKLIGWHFLGRSVAIWMLMRRLVGWLKRL